MATKSTLGYNGIPVPVGTLMYHAGTAVPYSFLLCDGASLSKSEYSVLYSVLGTSFGSVDAEHFSLPDLLTYSFLQGGETTNPVPVPTSIDFPATLVEPATIPSLSQANFAFQSWNLTASINGNNWFPTSDTEKEVGGTIKNAVKADSSDVNAYTGSVTGGTIGFENNAQEAFTPTVQSGSFEPASLTFLPIIKAFVSFVPPYYEPLPVATDTLFVEVPANQTYYTPNPENIYLNDPALSGFIF